MNNSSANAFLKTLEESKNSIFLCTTENKNLLLPTILSRFQVIEFYKLSDLEIREFLDLENLKNPHPNPLPEGEGAKLNTDDLIKYSF
jgi:DNA polymerase-3 subunit delta'